ncbi:MAG TPA: AAA family ATPase, partial [Terricaulis sp.]|nr:AAA family ATPase [Terricaulis sp.]
MSSAPSHPARRLPAWARRPSLAARVLGEALTPANDVVDETQTLRAADLLSDEARAPAADNDALLNEDPPFDPPEADEDIFGAADGDEPEQNQAPALEAREEETPPLDLFYAPGPAAAPRPRTVHEEVLAFAEAEARAAEPALDAALQAILEEVVGDPLALAAAADDDEPPFDAPDASDAVLGPLFERTPEADAPPHPSLPAPDALLFDYAEIDLSLEPETPSAPEAKSGETPAPPIQIHASWDRPEIGRLLWDAAGDHRLARADMAIARGGIDGAAARFAGQASPDLLIIDTTLRRAELLAALDRLALAIEADCKIIIIGTINDIGLLRDLAARGVSEYIVPPFKPEDLARAIARLYAVQDQSRVIAVIGARGGVGASTIARNLAWSIAERQDACAALIDLDLAFGAAAFSLGKAGAQAMADALSAPDAVSDEMLARAAVQHTKHLQLLAGPAALERGAELEPEAVEALVRCARRANPYVVLDLPHAWTPWVKQALAGADEVVLVAAPDLASLRNAKSMVETLAPLRADKSPVLCALSMTGVPKRPEISAKDFTETVGVSPSASFAFDPQLFGQCETNNQMIGEADPLSKTAAALDALATALTGRKPNPRKRAPDAAILARDEPADFAKSPKRGLRDLAPAPSENVLVLTRETSVGALAAAYEGEAESEYLAKARAAAQNELDAQQSARPRLRWGRVSLAAAAAALALVSVAWRSFEAP